MILIINPYSEHIEDQFCRAEHLHFSGLGTLADVHVQKKSEQEITSHLIFFCRLGIVCINIVAYNFTYKL